MNPPFDNEPVVKPELYVEIMNDYEKVKNKIEKEDTKSYLEELKGDFSQVMVVYEAFMHDPNAHLFIAVRNKRADANSCTIYFFTKQNSRLVIPSRIEIESNILLKIISKWDDLSEHLINQNEEDIKCTGRNFYDWLVKDVLPTGYDRMCEVWIYCEDADIDPIWEWLCTKSSNGECSFWGDKFSIVRIPKNGNFEIERSGSQINSVAILLDKACECAISDMQCLSNLCQHPVQISDYNLKSLHNVHIGHRDYMHIAADIKIIKKNYDDIIQAVKIAASLSEKLFIFYNIWNDEEQRSMHDIRLEVVDSIPAKTRIYTSLDVPKYFAALFAKCFYDCVVEENDVAKAIKKAREEIKNGYLFSTTKGELENDLNERNIREESKGIFKHEDIELSGTVTVENNAEENDIWMMSDREKKKTYLVKKKDGKLTIYETNRNLSFDRFWRFAYVVNGNPFTAATWARS